MKSFMDLKVWRKAHELTLSVYQVTKSFPNDEKFGLVAQVRRSSASVPTNIVEGFKRHTKRDQMHFFNLSESSLEETKYQLLLSRDLGYISMLSYDELFQKAEEIGRMLHGYVQSVSKRTRSQFTVSLASFLILNSLSLILYYGGLS